MLTRNQRRLLEEKEKCRLRKERSKRKLERIEKYANSTPRRSSRKSPPIRHLSGTFSSLFEDSKCDPATKKSRITVLKRSPNVFKIEHFLTRTEIESIKSMCKKRFKRSFTDDDQGNKILTENRTSTFTFLRKFQDSTVRSIERRAAEFVGLPPANVEPLQIVSYTKGQHFDVHHDLGPWDGEGVEFLRNPTRLATFFVYLNTLSEDAGGHTEFPKLNMSVRPVAGTAVVWSNVRRDSDSRSWIPDARTVHRGCPVAAGRKLGLNIWITDSNLIGYS